MPIQNKDTVRAGFGYDRRTVFRLRDKLEQFAAFLEDRFYIAENKRCTKSSFAKAQNTPASFSILFNRHLYFSMSVYTVISTDPDELDIQASYKDCSVSTAFMSQQGLFDWYADAFGEHAAKDITVDTIIDSLAGEYVITESLVRDDYIEDLELLLGIKPEKEIEPEESAEEAEDKLIELLNEDDRFQIRNVDVTGDISSVLPPTDGLWLGEVALHYEKLPEDHALWFAEDLKQYLDSVATAFSWQAVNEGPMPNEMQRRVRINTFLLKSAVVEHVDSSEALDLFRHINATIRDATNDMAPTAYDH